MQLIGRLLVEVALLLIGMTKISWTKLGFVIESPFRRRAQWEEGLFYLLKFFLPSNGKTSIVYYRTRSFFAFRFKKKRKFAFLLLF